MLTASVIWGVILSTRAFPEHRRPAWLLDLHRWLGGLTVRFVAIHLVALVADSYTHFGPADLADPLASNWKPGAVALGVDRRVAARRRRADVARHAAPPESVWRGIHLTSYGVFWLASIHAAFAGSDRTTGSTSSPRRLGRRGHLGPDLSPDPPARRATTDPEPEGHPVEPQP